MCRPGPSSFCFAGDVQDFMFDDVAKVVLIEDQFEIAFEHDLVRKFERDGRIGREPFFAQPFFVDVDVPSAYLANWSSTICNGLLRQE